MTGTARERLLRTADQLFYREGVHTVGIDRILEASGVAKATLYSAFGSKDELVRAYLEGRAERLQGAVTARVDAAATPRERILAVFDAFDARLSEGRYFGCPFVRACAETPAETDAAREVATAHRAWRRSLLLRLSREAGFADPEATSRQLSLLYDGAAVAAAMEGEADAARVARAAAAHVIDAAAPKKSTRSRARTK
ncbi:MAG TPA: TetR/AcrR family transcriptional regulator [Kofleriaceae bacterium]|jgi:AcrR family transcriptional regulator